MKKNSKIGTEVNNSSLLQSVKNPEYEISIMSSLMEVKINALLETLGNSGQEWFYDSCEDPFKNKENFIQGINYITAYGDSQLVEGCISLIDQITDKYEEMADAIATFLSFFCEVGVWKNCNVRKKELYHKDFSKYLKNCMVTWLGNDYNYWFAL